MNVYEVIVQVTIMEKRAEDGQPLAPHSQLSYSTTWDISGENLTMIAPTVDGMIAAMKNAG